MAVAALSNDFAGSALAGARSVTAELSDRFLKLLVTQLKNQDPMNPMENAELTMQLAQMSTVEGISRMNATLDGLVEQFRSTQALQGASLVGRQVMAEGDALLLTAAGAAGGVSLAKAAESVTVSIWNDAGALVGQLALGALPAGFHRFVWDGADVQGNAQAPGQFQFRASATSDGQPVTPTTYALGTVRSVALLGDGVEMDVAGLGMRGLGQVKEIY